MANTVKVKLVKGLIGTERNSSCDGAGSGIARKSIQSPSWKYAPAVRGMINKGIVIVKVVS